MSFYDISKLDSGLTIVTERVPNIRSVAIGFWVSVGSRFEDEANNGMSHFIEHMLFKGTHTRSAQDICQTFEILGAELNAFTTKEFTCFYARLIDEHLETGVEVLADMLQDPLFKSEHIDFERQVVLEEIAMYEDTPDELIHDLFTANLWPQHPLGKQVLGHKATVKKFNPAQIKKYFKTHYYPGNIIIAAAGNINHKDVVDLVNKYYKLSAAGEKIENTQPAQLVSKLAIVNKSTEQVHICLGTITLNANHPDRFALAILENIIGGGMSSRLFQKVREAKGLAYSIFSYHSLYQETGNIAIYAGTRESNLNKVLNIIADELINIVDKGVTEEEFNRSREHLKGRLVLGLESARNRMTRLGKSALIHEDIISVNELIAKIMAVSRDDVNKLAKKILRMDKMVLTIIGPVKPKDIKTPLKFDEITEI